ncbi:MAG TPA: hypothetical protein PKI12_01980, partial [Bacteroidales bacterium]|nr:hypothetical protein [Bacteroidales bacterium]
KPFERDSETVKALRQNNASDYVNQMMKYWGTQPGTDGPHYMGAIVIFLFILGLILVKGRDKWWMLIATLLSIMLAWGSNFMPLTDLFVDYFPGYNKFRSVTFILVIAQFCVPLLGFLALKELFYSETPGKKLMKGFLTALSITSGLLLLFLVFPGIAGSFLNPFESDYPDVVKETLVTDRRNLLTSDALRSLLFILAGAGIILAAMYNKLKKEYAILIVGLLVLADLWSVDKRYLNADRFFKPAVMQKSFTPTVADQEILKDKSHFRVWNRSVSSFNDNSPTSYFHNSIGGYHGAKLRRYQEVIDSAMGRDIFRFDSTVAIVRSEEDLVTVFEKTPILNMLNTKYIIFHPSYPPLLNQKALGNAWFVQEAMIAENANAELAALLSIDPAREAVIDMKFGDMVTAPKYTLEEGDKIELESVRSNELVYRYSAKGERLAVFSEIYYPSGWKAFIDGKESKHFRADYVLRAMVLPGGDHEVRFLFDPSSYKNGNRISLASSLLLILLLAGYGAKKFLKK